MPWVARAVYSDVYTLRSADTKTRSSDPTSYIPGQIISVYLKVLKYDWKYRGLFLHAVDSSNATVGSWELPASANALFWEAPLCPNAVMHTDAEHKPFTAQLRFKAPAAGTGTIAFRALIKKGPANTGFFYFPNKGFGDLTLTEAASPPPPPANGGSGSSSSSATTSLVTGSGATSANWLVSKPGQSCEQACAGASMSCDASAMTAVQSSAALQQVVGGSVACTLPILSDCSSVSPTMGSDGTCYYHSDTTCATPGAVPAAVDCQSTGTSPANSRRFCACAVTSGSGGGTSASAVAARPSSPLLAGSLLLGAHALLLGGGRAGQRSSGVAVSAAAAVSLLLLSLAPGAQAHNWLWTPARAQLQASTLKPCRGRIPGSTHAQVGPGQDIVVKWATGHNRKSYWTVIHEDDAAWMRRANFSAMVEDYIALAPAGSNTAQQPQYQRYHGTRKTGTSAAFYDSGGNGLYSGKVAASSPNFLTLPPSPTIALYQYTAAKIAGDRRVSYQSAKYPWLQAAATYEQLYHLPSDYDAVRISIPAFSKPGHYVVGWKWSGYYDCVDVDKMASPVANVYGVDEGDFVYNKVDHCQYLHPRSVRTPCTRTTGGDAGPCKAALEAAVSRSATNDALNLGIAIVPETNPSTVAFPEVVNVPYGNATCTASGITALQPATLTRSALDWAAWGAATEAAVANTWCTSFTALPAASFRDAVAACTATSCPGIAWQVSGSLAAAQAGVAATHTFRICRSTATAAQTGWTLFNKKAPAPIPAISGTPFTANVNFQPASASLTLPAGMVADTGLPYGPRGGSPNLDYGWNCGVSLRLRSGTTAAPDTTYISSLRRCSTQKPQTWSVAAPNGIYKAELFQGGGGSNSASRGCSVNNVRVSSSFGAKNTVNRVQVTDGKIALQGTVGQSVDIRPTAAGSPCSNINSIKVTQVATALPPVWLPTSTNPWWQSQLSAVHPIGLVTINLPGVVQRQYSCRSWWFYRGNKCDDTVPTSGTTPAYTSTQPRELGWFLGAGEGGTVRVSNSSCNGAATCPGVVCSHVTKVQVCLYSRTNLCPIQVDCGGAYGRYVSVQLPGSGRILDVASIVVNRAKPQPPAGTPADASICYGVEARTQTETTPQYVISLDPEDPVFYSTCYARSRNITWLPTGTAAKPPPRWRFNSFCLNCSSFRDNVLLPPTTPYPIPTWRVNRTCFDCSRSVEQGSNLIGQGAGAGAGAWTVGHATATSSGNGNGNGGGSGGITGSLTSGVGFKVAVGAGGLLVVAAIAVVVVRSRGSSSSRGGGGGGGEHAFDPSKLREAPGNTTGGDIQMATAPAAVPTGGAAGGEWQLAIDPANGSEYYYNTRTQETQWEKPAGFN